MKELESVQYIAGSVLIVRGKGAHVLKSEGHLGPASR